MIVHVANLVRVGGGIGNIAPSAWVLSVCIFIWDGEETGSVDHATGDAVGKFLLIV